VGGKRGSQWISPDLENYFALRCWLGFEVCYKGSSDVLVARADDVDPFPSLRVLEPENKPQVRDACFSLLLLSRRTHYYQDQHREFTQSHCTGIADMEIEQQDLLRSSFPGRFGLCAKYWTRAVKSGDGIWHQYGVSERPTDSGPESFFTCRMKARTKRSEQTIRELCRLIASGMRARRSADYSRCTCNLKTWQNRRGPGGCHVSWYNLGARMTRSAIDYSMRHHDRLCSCGCFNT
jgi:hypothetical protein